VPPSPRFDVLIIGGSLAGSASALLLLRDRPTLRIGIIEKSTHFPRRVGEATVEVSGFFLSRVLGLTGFLNETQLTKQGMRFWFANTQTQSLPDCSEVGGRYLARVPAWQVDRSTLDEEVLRRAANAGAQILRPAKARNVQLSPAGLQQVTVESDGTTEVLSARWVIDASGFTALVARQQGWLRPNTDHPTTACWARWQGVQDWDSLDLTRRYPEWGAACHGIRNTATNHVVGDGWWAWFIPLRGGDTSVGVVFDHRRVRWPEGHAALGDRLKSFLCTHPAAAEILRNATPIDGDVKWRAQLAYTCDPMASEGVVLAGDAAGFIDPLYSPGMDWLSYTTTRAVELVRRALDGEPVPPLVEAHNADFKRSIQRWFDAVYRDKYAWMGDYELLRIGFQLDLGMYYLGVVSQPFRDGPEALRNPVFSLPPSRIPFWLMATYNRRLARIAETRRRRGTFGRANHHQRFLLNGFLPDHSSGKPVLRALLSWLALELREGWRT
jgi:flavin-dependent dehydrogenase